MLPETTGSLKTRHTVKMLAIIEQSNVASGCHTDNTKNYLLLMILKMGMDIVVYNLCGRKRHTYFISMCSLTIILADMVMVFLTLVVSLRGHEQYFVSLCGILAHASVIHEVLPLPMMCLGLLDYCLEGNYLDKRSAVYKPLRNVVLTLLVWLIALVSTFSSANTDLMELSNQTGLTVRLCEVRECKVITYFVIVLFTAVICTMLPFWPMISQWMKEAERLSEAREEGEHQSSNLLYISTKCTETRSSEQNYMEQFIHQRPPLWFSLTLGFSTFWMPYLIVSVVCEIFGFGIPAYILVNLMWLECTNSLLIGVVFWANSKSQGPYSQLPDNVCLWQVYWHLSKGTQHQQFPTATLNPSKVKRNTLLYV